MYIFAVLLRVTTAVHAAKNSLVQPCSDKLGMRQQAIDTVTQLIPSTAIHAAKSGLVRPCVVWYTQNYKVYTSRLIKPVLRQQASDRMTHTVSSIAVALRNHIALSALCHTEYVAYYTV